MDDYWRELGGERCRELGRYAAVIHLRTPAVNQGYNHVKRLRVESALEALELDERILQAWEGYPGRVVVPSEDDFVRKAFLALEAIRDHLPSCCRTHTIPPRP